MQKNSQPSYNIPYVKQYDANGVLLNPINGSYKSPNVGRRNRRFSKSDTRFMNNRSAINMVVVGTMRFQKFVQTIKPKNGGKPKRILHTVVPKTPKTKGQILYK